MQEECRGTGDSPPEAACPLSKVSLGSPDWACSHAKAEESIRTSLVVIGPSSVPCCEVKQPQFVPPYPTCGCLLNSKDTLEQRWRHELGLPLCHLSTYQLPLSQKTQR